MQKSENDANSTKHRQEYIQVILSKIMSQNPNIQNPNVTVDQVMGDFYNRQQASNRTVETLIASLLQQHAMLQKRFNELSEEYDKTKKEHPEIFKEAPKTAESPKIA